MCPPPPPRRQTARVFRRQRLGAVFLAGAMLTATGAQASPASDLYAAATKVVRENYHGWSTRNFRTLEAQYARKLARACAPQGETCSYDTGRAVLGELLADFGDAHTYVRDPEGAARYRESEQGQVVPRTGLRLARVQGGLLVASVAAGSPADLLGVRRLDLITQVNGQAVGGLLAPGQAAPPGDFGPNEFARLERTGQAIDLTLRRAGEDEQTLKVIGLPLPARDRPEPVWVGAGGRVAVIDLPSFLSPDTAAEFLAQVRQLQASGVRRLIVDLRFNGGGNLQQCVAAASIFGPVVYNASYAVGGFSYSGLDGREGAYLDSVFASPSRRVWTGPAAVLIGPDTASCAEVFAYYAQKGGARLVGEATKGVANSGVLLRNLPDGGLIAVTVFRGYATGDVPLPARLTPDVPAPLDIGLLTTQGRDTGLEAALSALGETAAPTAP
ncbi:S41 family peptidase [Deinococcus wulumuqiensis]